MRKIRLFTGSSIHHQASFRQLPWRQDPETPRPSGATSDAVIMAKDDCWIRLNIVHIIWDLVWIFLKLRIHCVPRISLDLNRFFQMSDVVSLAIDVTD
jgi:hypothetical protein